MSQNCDKIYFQFKNCHKNLEGFQDCISIKPQKKGTNWFLFNINTNSDIPPVSLRV
jgi:hypothetical protein